MIFKINEMNKNLLAFLAIAGLVLTLLPSLLVFNEMITFEMHRTLMAIGFVLWFVAAPGWMRERAA